LLIVAVIMWIALPLVALLRAGEAQRKAERLHNLSQERMDELLRRVRDLERRLEQPAAPLPHPIVEPQSSQAASLPANITPPGSEAARSFAVPPPLPVPPPRAASQEQIPAAAIKVPKAAQATTPPVVKPFVSLEQFMGVKLFAWVGGLALFLGIVFFVKLSIDRGWISEELRTAIGYTSGLALVAAGVRITGNRAYAVLGQTLCATGVVALYGMTYVAHAYYKFSFFAPPLAAFAIMALLTTGAFLLAVRLEAQVVAVLGMIGGFLTPILCSTGEDNPLGLFGYIALLDLGVLAVTKVRRWSYLSALAAGGTVLMQLAWFGRFFQTGGYAVGALTWVPVAVFLGFALLFSAAVWVAARDDGDFIPAGSALALCGSAMLVAFTFLGHDTITTRPALLYAYVLGINLVVMATAWRQPLAGHAPVLAGLLTFLHLAMWTVQALTPGMLPAALVIFLLFGLMHTAFSAVWHRRQVVRPVLNVGWVPVATLLLVFVPVVLFRSVSLLVWPTMLLVDLAIIGLAFLTRSLLPVFAALLVTMITVLAWLLKQPATGDGTLWFFLVLLGVFAVVFAVTSTLLARRLQEGVPDAAQQELARWLPVTSAVLPFALLILATLHLQVAEPSQVFGPALLLSLFLLGLGRLTGITSLSMTALLCVLSLEGVWHLRSFAASSPWLPLAWYLGFHALFSLHPHLFRRQLLGATTPWATAALAGVGTFVLVHALIKTTWPNDVMGLLPAAFAVPALLGLAAVVKLHPQNTSARLSQLAWFGGVALFFIILIFPMQWDKQWLTVSWALEGAALCWLFRRAPHPGLRATGAALLAVAFVRLSLNPAVLDYHIRGEFPIWNWQLYSYSLVAAAQFLAAWWLAPPCHLLGGINLRGLFCALGGVLLFLLLNIEIADAFTPAGNRSIAFQFTGNLARDMTYSIAWGLFAFGLLVIGFVMKSPVTRYVGIGLLGVTLLKLFLLDLANLDNIYRIGALVALAFIALAASFLYQRFLDREPSAKP
ncbi:MAG: DUF2339 domain-containing protein, partial [Roseimicrobium sp.]